MWDCTIRMRELSDEAIEEMIQSLPTARSQKLMNVIHASYKTSFSEDNSSAAWTSAISNSISIENDMAADNYVHAVIPR